MKPQYLVSATIAAVMIAAAASNVSAKSNKAEVAAVNDVVFEVGLRGAGNSDFLWCGAASYARGTLGAGWKTDIYVARGRGKGQVTDVGTAAQFTLDPGAAGIEPIPEGQSFNNMAVGYSMSVQRANSLCSVPPDIFL